MRSRKFNPWCDSDKQTIPCTISLRTTYGTTVRASCSASGFNFVLCWPQNVRENPQCALWNNNNNNNNNNKNNNAEFEGEAKCD